MNVIHDIEGTIDHCMETIFTELNGYEIGKLKDALEYVRSYYPYGINLIGMAEDRLHEKEYEDC